MVIHFEIKVTLLLLFFFFKQRTKQTENEQGKGVKRVLKRKVEKEHRRKIGRRKFKKKRVGQEEGLKRV